MCNMTRHVGHVQCQGVVLVVKQTIHTDARILNLQDGTQARQITEAIQVEQRPVQLEELIIFAR